MRQDADIPVFPISSVPDVISKLRSALSQSKKLDWLCSPLGVRDILKYEPVRLFLQPLYVVVFSIDEDFETAVGLIRSLHESNKFIALDGSSGCLVDDGRAYMPSLNQATNAIDLTNLPISVERDKYELEPSEVKRLSMAHIREEYTSTVTYTGANKVTYDKVCRPKASSVQIHETRQVFLPLWSFKVSVEKCNYDIRFVEKGRGISVLDTDLDDCRICNETVDVTRLLCNSCGNLTHPPKPWKSCGYYCEPCGKTICKNCAYEMQEFYFLKTKLCETCANWLGPTKGNSIRKLVQP